MKRVLKFNFVGSLFAIPFANFLYSILFFSAFSIENAGAIYRKGIEEESEEALQGEGECGNEQNGKENQQLK